MFLSRLQAKTTTRAEKMGLQLRDKKVLVVGLARTGVAVARFLKNQGANVTATDVLRKGQLGAFGEQAVNLAISLELGGHNIESFTAADLIVVSPGVPEGISPIETARRMGVPVIGEIELASHFIKEPIVAITGTNGKTTTTRLLGDMLKASGRGVFVGGNIGNPLIGYVESEGGGASEYYGRPSRPV
jgi:UDP-N-acetylmuramoylalanine--D-glutamate ligase